LYVDLCKHCRKYDDAAAGTFYEVTDAKSKFNYNDDNGDVVTCGYPQCRKKDHTGLLPSEEKAPRNRHCKRESGISQQA
jgi:hypothetical protein